MKRGTLSAATGTVPLVCVGLLLVAVALLVFGCSSTTTTTTAASATTQSSGPTATTSGASTGGNDVTIESFSFNPVSLTVKVGDTVTWTNKDSVAHTVVSDDGTTFKSGSLDQGQTFSFTFKTAGTFPYHCSVHPNMKATITVQ